MTTIAFSILLIMAVTGFITNRQAARAMLTSGARMHSIPWFHGLYSGLSILVPVLLLILVWLVLQTPVVDRIVMGGLPAEMTDGLSTGESQLLLAEIKSISGGRVFGTPEDWKLAAAEQMSSLQSIASILLVIVTAAATAALFYFSRKTVSTEFRARQGANRSRADDFLLGRGDFHHRRHRAGAGLRDVQILHPRFAR